MSADLSGCTEPAPIPGRAERLLAAMHKVISHDLPNQLVAAKSLVALMMDETPDLAPEPREYLNRLNRVCDKAADLMDFLRQMARLERWNEPLDTVVVSHLVREVEAELKQRGFEPRPLFELRGKLVQVRAGPRALRQAIVELVQLGMRQVGGPSRVLVEGVEGMGGAAAELRVSVAAAEAPRLEGGFPESIQATTAEPPREVVLARELIASWGGSLRGPAFEAGVCRISVVAPLAGAGTQTRTKR